MNSPTPYHASPAAHSPELIIATRASPLALWQAHHVKDALQRATPGIGIHMLPLSTRGDEILDRSLSKIGGKGLFIKELEIALQKRQADLAVHSLKDVPMDLPPEFALAAVLEREDPRDAFVSARFSDLSQIPAGGIIGTSSLRRGALLKFRFPHLVIKPLRGNLNTRLAKLDAGEFDAVILAAAGLIRLNMRERIRSYIAPEISLPAPGQGAMAIEICTDRHDLGPLLDSLNHRPTAYAIEAERAVARAFQGGCQLPLAAYATLEEQASGQRLHLRALVAMPDGSRVIHAEAQVLLVADEAALSANRQVVARAAEEVVQALRGQGADAILSLCLQDAP